MSNKETILCYIHGYAGAPEHWDALRKRMASRNIRNHPEVAGKPSFPARLISRPAHAMCCNPSVIIRQS